MGGVPPVPEAQGAATELETPRVNTARLHVEDRPKPNLLQEEEGDPHLHLRNAREGHDSDDYSTASESGDGRKHRRHRQVQRGGWHRQD